MRKFTESNYEESKETKRIELRRRTFLRRPEVPGFWPSNGVVWTRLIDISVAGEQGTIQIGASTQPKPVQSDRDGNREREREAHREMDL